MAFLTKDKNNNKPEVIKKDYFLQGLVKEKLRNRLWITSITIVTFLFIMFGISYALLMDTALDQEWKEILLFVLGAFIGSYNRVIDFWFNSSERDKEMISRADEEDNNNEDNHKN